MENRQNTDNLFNVKNQKTKGSKKQISIADKMKLIEMKNSSVKTSEICEKFNITEGEVRYIIKNQEKIVTYADKSPNSVLNRKNIKAPYYVELEERLIMWFNATRTLGYPVTESLIKKKHLRLRKT